MADIVDRATRSRMMSGIKSRDTRIELVVRQILHEAGYRYRLNVLTLPGAPDLVLRRYGVVIFVHGCFWHGHECHLFRMPSTRPEFWRTKIDANRRRDARALSSLRKAGWRVITIWECATKGTHRLSGDVFTDRLIGGIESGVSALVVRGTG